MKTAKLPNIALPFSLNANIQPTDELAAIRPSRGWPDELENLALLCVIQAKQVEVMIYMREKGAAKSLADSCESGELFQKVTGGIGVSCFFPGSPTFCCHCQEAEIKDFVREKRYWKRSSRMGTGSVSSEPYSFGMYQTLLTFVIALRLSSRA